MNITAKITGIKYKLNLQEDLKIIDINNFDINQAPSCSIITNGNHSFAISKWLSPKRTRSYPYERVYNTLHISKKITVIPVVKDEGANGDRDFLQWDTVSLMSLLDVYVIFAYYSNAEKKNNKITKQQFDNNFILSKISEIMQYHSSALHWNLNELNSNLHNILSKIQTSYIEIENKIGVKLHNFDGLENFKEKIGKDVEKFMLFSRNKAEHAQQREFTTIQPKESLSSLSKAKITISNYLGGLYYFTVDEINITQNNIYLIEGKHSNKSILPSKGDIKDGLLKMILYSNLCAVEVDNKNIISNSVLSLTSSLLKDEINSRSSINEIETYFKLNKFSKTQIEFIKKLFIEANDNDFIIHIKYSI